MIKGVDTWCQLRGRPKYGQRGRCMPKGVHLQQLEVHLLRVTFWNPRNAGSEDDFPFSIGVTFFLGFGFIFMNSRVYIM